MSQENIAYERELGNINIRGKRGKKTVPFGIKPVAVEAYKDRIDSEIPVVVPQEVKDIVHSRYLVEQGEKERQDALVGARKDASSSVKGANLDNIGLSRVTPIDTYRMEHEYNVTPSNEINYHDADAYTAEQAQRIKEEAFKDEEKKAAAPVVDEDVPIIDETLEYEPPTEEMKKFEEEKTQAQWEKDYFDSIWSKEDEEAAKKKQKAAQWILAAQMLGDSIGALSNVYWTGKGANAQKLEPGAQKAAAATYQLEQDIRNAREKAAKAKLDATLKKHEMEMQRERYASEQAESRRRYDEGMAYRRERDAIVDAREKELMEFRRQQENRIAKSSRGASTSTKDVEPIEFTLGDGGTIGIDKFNKDKLNRLYRSLPEDVRYAIENEEVYNNNGLSMGTKKRKVTDDDRLQAIYDNLDNPEVANAIRRLAGVKVKEVDPKENTPTNTTEPPIQAYSSPAEEWGSQWRRRAGLEETDFNQYKRK